MKLIYAALGPGEHQKRNMILWSIFLIVFSRLIFYGVFLGYEYVTGAEVGFWDALNKWDAGWYTKLTLNGYETGPIPEGDLSAQTNWAFFPLMPMIIHFLYTIFGGNLYVIVGITMSAVSAGILVLTFYYFQETGRSLEQAVATQVFMAAGLYSFYFLIFYTEAFYLFFLLLTLYFLQKKKYIAMGISGALLSATRNTGIMVVFAVAVKVITDYFHKHKKWSVKSFFAETLGDWRLVLGTCLIPFGLFSFMFYLGKLMGDPLAFLHVQVGWGIEEKNAVSILWEGLTSGNAAFLYMSLWAIAGIILLLYLFIEKRWEEAVLAVIFLVIPLSVRLNSIPRYLIGAGLFTFSAGDFLRKRAGKGMVVAILVLSILGNMWLLNQWFVGKDWLT
jgi:hypothetical protein